MAKDKSVFQIKMGEPVEIRRGHTIEMINIIVGRYCHQLYIKENDNGLRVNHMVSVFNKDIMYFGGIVHLTGPDLGSVLCPGVNNNGG